MAEEALTSKITATQEHPRGKMLLSSQLEVVFSSSLCDCASLLRR